MNTSARALSLGRHGVVVILLWLCPAAALPAETLHYDAFLAGVKVGSAVVTIERDAMSYRISGSAAAKGVADVFSDWQSDFFADGRFVDGRPLLSAYGYAERDRKKRRILSLSDGRVIQVSNDQVRPPRPMLDGLDVLTAFFIDPDCWQDQLVHTGRYNYWLAGRASSTEGGCHLEVLDDDGDRERVHIVFDTHAGMRLPVRISTRGLLRGTIRLRTPSVVEQGSVSTD